MQFLTSDCFNTFATVFGLLGDAAVLILTIYTLHITAFSRKLELISPSYHGSTFYGEKIGLTLMNKSLHAIPIQSIFVLKRFNDEFYYIKLADYSDPVSIDSWSIKKIETEPFTQIDNWVGDTIPDYHEITKDAIIGIRSGNKLIWVKPYTKTPLRKAKHIYKRHDYHPLTVHRKTVDETVLSRAVDCVIHIRMKDVNGQICLHKMFGITGFDDGKSLLLSETLCGYNAIGGAGNTSDSIRRAIHDALAIDEENIIVQMIDS